LHGTSPEQDQKASDVIDITRHSWLVQNDDLLNMQEHDAGRSRMHPASSIMLGNLIDTARALGAAEGR
jgi:hypothetical protein